MTTARQDEEKVERQRQADRDIRQRDLDEERGRQGTARTGPMSGKDGDRRQLLEEKPFDFIQRTKPEDRLDDTSHHGQQTRDNVNPNIPSVSPDKLGPPNARVLNPGGIVDPNTLGMDQGQAGVAPPKLADPGPPQVGTQAAGEPGSLGDPNRLVSINEPPGSRVFAGEDGPNQIPEDPKHDLPPLVLTDISPDTIVAGSPEDLVLTVTGSGFTPNSVVMVDDEDMATTFVDQTTLTASVPVAAEAGVVDVEVARGEDLSDVLTFEFVAPAGTRSSQKGERKPKKAEPRGKRQKKQKGKR
jgi:hypothetical protein